MGLGFRVYEMMGLGLMVSLGSKVQEYNITPCKDVPRARVQGLKEVVRRLRKIEHLGGGRGGVLCQRTLNPKP